MKLESWNIASDQLRRSLGHNNFKSWIEPLEFVGDETGTAEFSVPTSFFGNYVRQHFEDQILYQLRDAGMQVNRVSFSVGRADLAAKQSISTATTKSSGIREEKAREIQGAKLDPRFVFDNFVVGKPNELAHAAAKRVAEAGPVSFNPLCLYGGVGLGKTHLMHAIAWELQSNRPDTNVMYLSAEQFMYRFVQALRERKMMDFKELFRSVDVLMVDDVQFIAGKDSTQEEFFHTFNALVDQNKQIIISADRAPGEIKNLEDRIASRREITVELTQDCLSDILRVSDRKITVEEIQRKVSEHYNIRLSDMLGPKRLRSFARPRQIAMYLCKKLTSRSLPEIGRRFGGRDHTTVMHGVRRIEDLRNQDSQMSDDLDMLRRSLEG